METQKFKMHKKVCQTIHTERNLRLGLYSYGVLCYARDMSVHHKVLYICTGLQWYHILSFYVLYLVFLCSKSAHSDSTRMKYTLTSNHLAPSIYLMLDCLFYVHFHQNLDISDSQVPG